MTKESEKEGDNVALLLIKGLECQNILKNDMIGKESTIIMNNCIGQIKNDMVL